MPSRRHCLVGETVIEFVYETSKDLVKLQINSGLGGARDSVSLTTCQVMHVIWVMLLV